MLLFVTSHLSISTGNYRGTALLLVKEVFLGECEEESVNNNKIYHYTPSE